jgi:hypothetical protein
MAAASLPFVVAPKAEERTIRVGNDEIGVLEFPLFGKVRLNERLMVRPEVFGRALLQRAAELAERIQAQQQVDEQEAGRRALRIIHAATGGQVQLDADEASAIEANAELLQVAVEELNQLWQEQRTRAITAMIRFRLPGCSSWSEEATTTTLADELQQAILRVYDQEERGELPVENTGDALDLMLDQLGKFGQVMKQSRTPTGASDSGSSADSGQLTLQQAPTDSPSKAPRRSSKRSTPAVSS